MSQMMSLTRQQDGVLQVGGEGAGQHVPEERTGSGQQEPVHLDLTHSEMMHDNKETIITFSPESGTRVTSVRVSSLFRSEMLSSISCWKLVGLLMCIRI